MWTVTVQVGLFLGPSNVITDPLLYMDMNSKWLVVCEELGRRKIRILETGKLGEQKHMDGPVREARSLKAFVSPVISHQKNLLHGQALDRMT